MPDPARRQAFEPASGISAGRPRPSDHARKICSYHLTPHFMSHLENPLPNDLDHSKMLCRELNDQFRKTFSGGTLVATQGVQALEDHILAELMPAIQGFNLFTESNDPHGEHDFGEVNIQGHRVWFKIDTYDNDMRYHSPDPTDPNVTKRVMTLMLPEEY